MLIFSMGVSIDGFVNDRDGDFSWTPPSAEQFRLSVEQVGELGAYFLGRRLYETMRVWENDRSLRSDADHDAFGDIWCALPKVVFSRTLTEVTGNARLASGSVADEIAATLATTDRPAQIGGARLAGQACELGLVDELRIFRYPVTVGSGTAAPDPAAFSLLETRPFANRVVYERYARRG